MAMVHPSRMGLVPQEPSSRRRSPSPRPRDRIQDKYDDGENDKGRDRGRERYSGREREIRRSSPKYDDYRRPVSPPREKNVESMYPNRKDHGFHRDPPPHNGYDVPRGGGGADYLEMYVYCLFA